MVTDDDEPRYVHVKRSDQDIIRALLEAAIDDLWHTDNMAERTNHELGYGFDDSHELVDYHDMIATAERMIQHINHARQSGDFSYIVRMLQGNDDAI